MSREEDHEKYDVPPGRYAGPGTSGGLNPGGRQVPERSVLWEGRTKNLFSASAKFSLSAVDKGKSECYS